MALSETIEWTSGDALRAIAVTETMLREGRRVWIKPDAARAVIELLSRAERVRLMAERSTGLPPTDVQNLIVTTVNGATLGELDALPDEVAAGYLAMRRAVTSLYATSRTVTPDTPTLDVPTVPAVAPAILIALTVVGVAAVAGVSWFAAEAVDSKVELEKHRITVVGQVDLYLKDLAARIAAGAPLPDPPKAIVLAAAAERNSGPILLGAGLLVGGAAVAGLVFAIRKPTSPTFAQNPRTFGRRSRARSLGKASRRRRARPELPPSSRRLRRTNPGAPSGKIRAVMAIARNAAPSPASFINADERRAVNAAVKRGWMRILETGKWRGRTEVHAVNTSAGDHALRANPKPVRKARPKKRNPGAKITPLQNPKRRRKVVVRPHKRASKKCGVCGQAHTARQHWSHKFAAKKGPRGGAYRRKRKAAATRPRPARKKGAIKKAAPRKRPPRAKKRAVVQRRRRKR